MYIFDVYFIKFRDRKNDGNISLNIVITIILLLWAVFFERISRLVLPEDIVCENYKYVRLTKFFPIIHIEREKDMPVYVNCDTSNETIELYNKLDSILIGNKSQ